MKLRTFSSLRVRLLLLVLIAVVPAMGVIWHMAQQQRRASSVEAQQYALRVARLISANQHDLVEGARQLLIALAQVPSVRSHRTSLCSEFLGNLLKAYSLYANLGVVDSNGEVACSGLPRKGRVSAADRSWFQSAFQTHDFAIGEYQIGRITGKAQVNFAYPILDNDGQTQAVVFAALDLSWLNKLNAKSELPPGAIVTVIDRTRMILARYPDSEKWVGHSLSTAVLAKSILARQKEGTAEATDVDGVPRLYGFTSLGDETGHAYVIIGIPRALAFASTDSILEHGVGWLILICVFALTAAWLGGDRLVLRQITGLIRATKRLGSGDLTVRAEFAGSTGELRELALAFDHMAEALQNRNSESKQTQETLQRYHRQDAALREINLAVTSTLELQAVLKVLMEKMDVLLPYTDIRIWLINPESQQLERAACWNIDEQEWKSRKLRDIPNLIKEAISNRAPVIAEDLQTDPRTVDPDFYRRNGLVSYLGLPLLAKGEVQGVIVFLTRKKHPFSNEEVQFLSLLAGQAAIAIHNSQLFEQTKKKTLELHYANRDLRRKEKIEELLKKLSQDITSLDIDALLKNLTAKVREFLRVDLADVRILEGERWRLKGVSGSAASALRSGMARRRTGWILKNRRPLVISDITASEQTQAEGSTEKLGLRGYLGVPVFSREGEIIGVLRALSYQPREFTPEEVDLLEQMANGAGIALENAKLLDRIKNQAVQLEKANTVKDEFLRFVSHELKTPVNVVMGYAELLKRQDLGQTNLDQRKGLEKILANSSKLLSMINTLLEATKIQAGAAQINIEAVNLCDFVEELKTNYEVPLNKKVMLIWDCPPNLPLVNTDGDKLSHVLQNLIDNAIKYTDQGNVTLSARHLSNADSVEFKITDTGIGISDEALPFIFEMFRQVHSAERREGAGVGLGLHIVKQLTALLEGEIHVQSEVDKGSTFVVKLPVKCKGAKPSSGSVNTFLSRKAAEERSARND